jgi:phosphoglycerate kinase
MKCIHEVSPELLKGKYVLVRTDFNVPIIDGVITDVSRIEASFKTISYLKNSGARIILMSHIGRDPQESLEVVYSYLKNKLPLSFVSTWIIEEISNARQNLKDGDVLLLQNLRAHTGEEMNDPSFAHLLSSLADIYVNEAFSASHREHASIVGVPQHIKSYCGCRFKLEFDTLSKIFNPEHPFVVLMGGAKFETKIPVIEALITKADSIFVGGALANDILKANGYEVGLSKVNDMDKVYAEKIYTSKKVIIVEDVKVKSFLFNTNKHIKDISKEDKIIDGGSQTASLLSEKIKEAKLIVWNGPFGTFEQGNSFLSKKVIEAIQESDAYTIVGGGDTVSEIKKLGKEDSFDFISLSGGAMLEFVAEGTLVGIESLK